MELEEVEGRARGLSDLLEICRHQTLLQWIDSIKKKVVSFLYGVGLLRSCSTIIASSRSSKPGKLLLEMGCHIYGCVY